MLHTYGVCAGGDGGSVRGVKAASLEEGEDMFAGVGWTDLVEMCRSVPGKGEGATGSGKRREGEEICSIKPVLRGADL